MKRHLLTQTMLTTQTSVRKQTANDVHSCHEYLDISPKQLKYEADFSVLFMHTSLCTRGFIRGLTHFQKLKRASHQQYTHTRARMRTHTHARTHTHTHTNTEFSCLLCGCPGFSSGVWLVHLKPVTGLRFASWLHKP